MSKLNFILMILFAIFGLFYMFIGEYDRATYNMVMLMICRQNYNESKKV